MCAAAPWRPVVCMLALGMASVAGAAGPSKQSDGDADHSQSNATVEMSELIERVEQLQSQVDDLEQRLERKARELDELRASTESGDARLAAERHAALQRQIDDILAQVDARAANGEDGYGGYGEGTELSFWAWLTYLHQTDPTRNTFWAWEVEMSASHTFTERLAGTVDLDFIDMNDGANVEIEQAFLSLLVSPESGTVATVGKFNAPFGIEARDFWNRYAGSTSLLFQAMPQDLTGVIVTQPLGDTGLTLQPFVVNGWDQNLDNNNQPSIGLVSAWEPTPDWRFAVTNYYGPEEADRVGDKLYLLVAEGRWYATPSLFLAGEGLFGTVDSPQGWQTWSGAAAEISLDLDAQWRVFGRWSYLDDADGFVRGAGDHYQEFGLGGAYYPHPDVEFRAEYRRDFANAGPSRHSGFGHVTFGF